MSIKNKVQLVGHVGQNPEIRTFGDSGKLATFSVATNENYQKNNGEWVENTTWHRLKAWRNQAERVERMLQKGSYVMIEGKLSNSEYTDQDNIKRYITEIEVIRFMPLDKKSSNEHNGSATMTEAEANYKASAEDDDLPF